VAKKHMTDLICKSTIYITPAKVADPVREYFGGAIPLDPATEPTNPLSATQFCAGPSCNGTSLGDGLTTAWSDYKGTFVNPPYGKDLKHWCKKIHEEAVLGASILALLPCGARFGTKYWQEHIFNQGLDVALFVKGRVQFLRPDGSGTQGQNPADSCIWGFNVDVARFTKCFNHLGTVIEMQVV